VHAPGSRRPATWRFAKSLRVYRHQSWDRRRPRGPRRDRRLIRTLPLSAWVADETHVPTLAIRPTRLARNWWEIRMLEFLPEVVVVRDWAATARGRYTTGPIRRAT